jgi:hypothetical protein
MPTYAELALEPQWRDESLAPALAAFNQRMATAFQLNPLLIGSKGDNNHLYGRHRSRRWDMTSRWCTDRSYATTAARDQIGDGNWLRATDIGISGPVHWAAAHRLDTAVRAGLLPCIAEWFGTFNGQVVVGWFEGSPSSSDTSHLTHLHVGIWTGFCDNAQQLTLLGDIITGAGTPGGDMFILHIPAAINPNGQDEYWLYDQYGRVDQKPNAGDLRAVYSRGGCPTVELSPADLPSGWTWGRFLSELESTGAQRHIPCECDCGDGGGTGGGVTMAEVRTVINQTRLVSEEPSDQ